MKEIVQREKKTPGDSLLGCWVAVTAGDLERWWQDQGQGLGREQ